MNLNSRYTKMTNFVDLFESIRKKTCNRILGNIKKIFENLHIKQCDARLIIKVVHTLTKYKTRKGIEKKLAPMLIKGL